MSWLAPKTVDLELLPDGIEGTGHGLTTIV